MNPSPPARNDTHILYSCPRHPNDTLKKKNTNTQYGYWSTTNALSSIVLWTTLRSTKSLPNVNSTTSTWPNPCTSWRVTAIVHLSCPCSSQRRIEGHFTSNVPNVVAISSNGWIKNPEKKPEHGWKRVDSMEFENGIQDPKSCSYPSKKTLRGRRPKFGRERKKEREGRKNLEKGNVSIQRKWEMEQPKNEKGNACTSRKRRIMEEPSLISWRGDSGSWQAP